MSNDIDAQVIQKTQKVLGKYVKKPPLTDKLLRKPPFRFLHDVVNSVIRETSFLKGLYSERELVSENVKDKDEKVAFLNKLIDATKTITGIELNVKSTKVIAGLEPTETNLLLQAIGIALDKKLDSSLYTTQLKSEKKSKSHTNLQGNGKKIKHDKTKENIASKQEEKKKTTSIPTPKNAVLKRLDKIKSGKTSSSKDSVESSRNEIKEKGKIKKIKEKTSTPRENAVKSVQQKVVAEILHEGDSNVQKVINVINDTNAKKKSKFEETNDNVNISKQEQSRATDNVLQQDGLKQKTTYDSETEENIEVKNIKQVAGQIDTSGYSSEVPMISNMTTERLKSAKPKSGILKINSEETDEAPPFKEETTERLKSTKRRTTNAKVDNDLSTLIPSVQLENNFEKPLGVSPTLASTRDSLSVSQRVGQSAAARVYRKISIINAHAPSEEAEEEDKLQYYEKLEAVYENIPNYNIKIVLGDFNAKVGREGKYKPVIEENIRPRSSLRPPSVRPSSARPGAPRLRNDATLPEGEVIPLGKVNVIVESYNSKELDEEETVTIQATPELEYQAPILQLPTDKGHLVEQILEQINHTDVMEQAKPTVNIEWEQDGFRSRNAANKEIEQLKSAIQTLTRTANPLGKLVNYLHEDIEAMHSELDSWINSARQIMVDVTNQKRISDESNKPLQAQLAEIEDNIMKHQQQIVAVHGNILRNEQRIKDLLIK